MTTQNEAQVEKSEWELEREAKRAAERLKLDALYNGVAKFLEPDGWVVESREPDEDYDNYRIWLTDGKGLANARRIELDEITYGADRGKIRIHGSWPQQAEHGPVVSPSQVGEDSPGIKATLSKGYEAIAKDIKRRFLPEYLRIWAKCQAKADQTNAYESKQAYNWARLGELEIVKPYRNGTQQGDVRLGTKKDEDSYNYDRGYGTINMESADSVKIELRSVPIDRAIAILKAIAATEVKS